MKTRNFSRIAVLMIGAMLAANMPTAAWAGDILVSAAASLNDVLTEIGTKYEVKAKRRVKFNFGPSSSLARQIDEGAPVDIFFSADLTQMDSLGQKNRLEPGTHKNLLSNQLVLIVPSDSKLAIESPKDLVRADVRKIALAEPSSVPVGVYTRKYLTDQGLWERLKAKIVPVQDVRATLASVESGNVEAGFVYKTDAAVSQKVKVTYQVPLDKGPKITYPVAVVRDSKRKDAARDFTNYLQSSGAKAIFKRYGFVVLD